MGENTVPYAGVVNAASLDILARGRVTITGGIQAGDAIDINVGGTQSTDSSGKVTTTGGADYKYTIVADDTINTIVTALVQQINAANSGNGDPNVYATPDLATGDVILTSRAAGTAGNAITVYVTVTAASGPTTAQITATASGTTLSGGGDASSIAPGSIVSVTGTNLSSHTASADAKQNPLPTKLGGTQVYFNGIAAPLMLVSPTMVNAQIPWELGDTTSINAYVRSESDSGSVTVTTPVAVTIVTANPGIYAQPNTSPSVGIVYHASSSATGIVSVDGTATAGDTATVAIEDRSYTYTVQSGDTLTSIRDALVSLINQDPKVTAAPSGEFQRIILRARVQGPDGNGLPYTASASSSATVIMTAIGSSLCCAAVANSAVTPDNPAVPGELIYVYATGLGLPVLTDGNKDLIQTGVPYPAGGPVTTPASFVNAIAGGKTADVISATLLPGSVGLYQVLLHLNPDLPTDPYSQLTIAQDIYVSNIVTLPIVAGGGVAAPASNTVANAVVASDAISFTIGPPPLTASNAFVNAANPSGGNAVAPGSIASLYGTNLAPQVAIPDAASTAAPHARRRDDDRGRRFRTVVLRLTDAVQFSSPAVYAHRPGIHLLDGHPGRLQDHLHGATETLCTGALHHQRRRHGTSFHVDRRHRFARGAQRRIPRLASGQDRRIHLDLRNRSRRRFEPARSGLCKSRQPAGHHPCHAGSHGRRGAGRGDVLRTGSRICRLVPNQRAGPRRCTRPVRTSRSS